MLKPSLCDYSDAYMLVKGTITVAGDGVDDARKWLDFRNKIVIFNTCAQFTDCLNKINKPKWIMQKIWMLLCEFII